MDTISGIGQTISYLQQSITQDISNLQLIAGAIHQNMQQVNALLQGYSGPETAVITAAMNEAQNNLLTAVMHLSSASQATDEWLKNELEPAALPDTPDAPAVDLQPNGYSGPANKGGSIWNYSGRTATNSYERAQLSKDEAKTFVHQTSGITDSLLSQFPEERRKAIDSAYAGSPDAIRSLLNHYGSQLKGVEESGHGTNEYGMTVKNGSFYSPKTQKVYMNEDMNDAEYTDVLKHELGHYMDHMLGTPSESADFMDAVQKGTDSISSSTAEGRQQLTDMLDDLFSTGACYDRNVTDIISALTRNDPIVLDRFDKECVTGYVANYTHRNDYWDQTDTNGNSYHKREKEIFANCFAIATDGNRISVDFVQRWFPSITKSFDRILGGK